MIDQTDAQDTSRVCQHACCRGPVTQGLQQSARRRLFLLPVLFPPELGGGLVLPEAETMEFGEATEELEVLRVGWKGDALEVIAIREGQDVDERSGRQILIVAHSLAMGFQVIR